MLNADLLNFLYAADACSDAMEWVEENSYLTPKELWETCSSSDWIDWVLDEIGLWATYEYHIAYSKWNKRMEKIPASKLSYSMEQCVLAEEFQKIFPWKVIEKAIKKWDGGLNRIVQT